LNPLDEDIVQSSRLTLLPQAIRGLRKRKLNFVALTPGTSFDLKSSLGRREERVLLWCMLPEAWRRGTAAINLLQGTVVDTARFRREVRELELSQEFDADLRDRFVAELGHRAQADRAAGKPAIDDRFFALAEHFRRRVRPATDEHRIERARLVGDLRTIVAATCLRALQPDLVILDEFQRFRDLLGGESEASLLARELFDYSDESSDVRVLLLSATPYKMYTLHHEAGEDNHYEDFLRTVGFLDPGSERIERLRDLLAEYRRELYDLGDDSALRLSALKQEIERRLRRVMCRTERVGGQGAGEMLREVPDQQAVLEVSDVRGFLRTQKLARHIDESQVLEYWKSAPYLLNFMERYKLKENFQYWLEGSHHEDPVASLLRPTPGFLFTEREIRAYGTIDPGNARLRGLAADTLDRDAWKALWLPPSLPYYRLGGAFAPLAEAGFTKRLVFSRWAVVPKALSVLLSYEAERRIAKRFNADATNTVEAREAIRQLLRFAVAEGRLTGMPVLGLLYPSFVLAEIGDPLRLAAGHDGLLELGVMRELVRAALAERLRPLLNSRTREGAPDESWYWAAPILLDRQAEPRITADWLGAGEDHWTPEELAADWAGTDDEDAESRWAQHVGQAQALLEGRVALGRPPADLLEVVGDLAIAGPAVCALRALGRINDGAPTFRHPLARTQAGVVAWSFRALFNQPEAMALLRAGFQDTPYWRRVLDYSSEGCLQATLDEYAHVLNEALGLFDAPSEKRIETVAAAMIDALSLRTSSYEVEDVRPPRPGRPGRIKPFRVRVHFAVRYGSQEAEAQGKAAVREQQVRDAFNSPFWPFVLVSTSVGQEGLDFHPYCHAIVHWNLPSNPVDLEQREGRIHRYKGHAVRKNVARTAGVAAFRGGSDPWSTAFELVSRICGEGDRGLSPYWVYALDGGATVDRYIPTLPLSRDCAHREALKRSLAVYRMVFGQPKQDDLLAYLLERLGPAVLKARERELAIDLRPRAG
jgi:hypothetical protein